MCWKIEKEIFGSVPGIRVFIITMVNPCLPDRQAFSILQQRMGLAVIQRFIFMKIEPAISGLVPEVEQAGTIGNLFGILQRKTDFPITMLILSWKTKQGNYGLAQGVSSVSMMEQHLPF